MADAAVNLILVAAIMCWGGVLGVCVWAAWRDWF